MIKLNKHAKPAVLHQNAAQWTAEYLRYIDGDGDVPKAAGTRYRHVEIKAVIKNETNEKCGYCESKIGATWPGDVEHLRPKSKFPELVLQWENLTLACGICNTNKGNTYADDVPLLNPYDTNIEERVTFAGSLAINRIGDMASWFWIGKLELNRGKLLARRTERLLEIQEKLNHFASVRDGLIKEAMRDKLSEEFQSHREYSRMLREFIKPQLQSS